MHAPVCACGQSLHKMVQYHLINLCMERLRGPQLPIHPYSTKDLEKKSFLGLLGFYTLTNYSWKKLAVTIKAVWEFNKHDPPKHKQNFSFFFLSLKFRSCMGKHKVNFRGPTLCFTKGQKDPISQKQFFLRQHSRILFSLITTAIEKRMELIRYDEGEFRSTVVDSINLNTGKNSEAT